MEITSNQLGSYFENLIGFTNMQYANKGLAKVEKNEPSVGIVKGSMKGKYFKGFFKKKGKLDYSGVIADGRGIAFECKATTRDKFYLDMMKAHQVEKIAQGLEVGEVTFVLVYNGSTEKTYIVYAEQLIEKYSKTPSGSFKWEELEEVESKNGLTDYRKTLLKKYSESVG